MCDVGAMGGAKWSETFRRTFLDFFDLLDWVEFDGGFKFLRASGKSETEWNRSGDVTLTGKFTFFQKIQIGGGEVLLSSCEV